MAEEKQRKTFLSYSRANKDFAIRLAKELKLEGFDIWLDQLDIPAGARWDREVEKALRESEIFMIILTPSSVDSENVLDEIGYAIDSSKRFLPVLLEKCDIPLRLRRFQYVDFTNKNFDDGVESAKELLRTLIAQPTVPNGVFTGSQVQAEAERLAARKAEEERLTRQKGEEEVAAKLNVEKGRQAKATADYLTTQKSEEGRTVKVEPTTTQKNPASRGFIFGIIVTITVVFLCAAVIGIRIMASLLPFDEKQPTNTIPPKASTSLPTNSPAPVSTRTIEPSPIPTTTPNPTATEATGSFFEDFSATTREWETGVQDNNWWIGSLSIENGSYKWDIDQIKKEDFVYRFPYPGSSAVENIDISVDALRTKGTPSNLCFGLYFRYTKGSYYRFIICDNQNYKVSYYDGNQWENLIEWTSNTTIRSDDWNNIRVVTQNENFSFYINQVLAATASDSRLPQGYAGLCISAYDAVPGQILLDNFQVTEK